MGVMGCHWVNDQALSGPSGAPVLSWKLGEVSSSGMERQRVPGADRWEVNQESKNEGDT
jgi:hypothetical protein